MSNDLFEPPSPADSAAVTPLEEPAWTPAPHRKKPRRVGLWVGVGVGALVLAGAVTAVVTKLIPSAESSALPAVTEPTLSAETAVERYTPPPTPEVTPAVADFELTPKITSKHCFGSAGCNVDFRVDMAYSGLPLGEDATWLVTYEVTGDESGPVIDTLELTGSTFSSTEQSISTKSSRTKITIKATSVDSQ